jgi:hypothetical protein
MSCDWSVDLITIINNTNVEALRNSEVREMLGSHSRGHDYTCLLGCCVLIILMMEAASTSEMSVNFHQDYTAQEPRRESSYVVEQR